jgi:hydroxymethylpyrimidine pyrophosphatase-like HAD family hydrolase
VTKAVYVDIDGTLVGPGGALFWNGSTRIADALVRAAERGLAVVPVSGRGRVQVSELCRLLGLARGVAELGCVHVEGKQVRYEFGAFPFTGETPVQAMERRGAVQAALRLGLEPHEPWNEGREATYLMRGRVDTTAANRGLAEEGFGWCELVDNGVLTGRAGQPHAYHLAPSGTGKAFGVRVDRERHGLAIEDVAYVGDSVSDLACAPEVGRCGLVANADANLDWPLRTTARHGEGVAEVIDQLLGERPEAFV